MAKFIFDTIADDYREASKIELTVPDDMTIFEYKTICIRMASALGYHPETISKAFVETETERKTFKDLINELTKETI
jgi:hypothetical protein